MAQCGDRVFGQASLPTSDRTIDRMNFNFDVASIARFDVNETCLTDSLALIVLIGRNWIICYSMTEQ